MTEVNNNEKDSPKGLIMIFAILLIGGVGIGVYFFNFMEKKTTYESPIVKENTQKLNNNQIVDNDLGTGDSNLVNQKGTNNGTNGEEIENIDEETANEENGNLNEGGEEIENRDTINEENENSNKENINNLPFVSPEGTNIHLEGVKKESIDEKIADLIVKYKADPKDIIIKTKVTQAKTSKKIINYFEKKNPDQKIIEFYEGDPMSYYFIKTEDGYYFVEMIYEMSTSGKSTTKLKITPIEGVDMATFELYDRYSKDKNNVYRDAEILSGVDSKTFISYDRNYAKDKNNIYSSGIIMKGVDYNTFEVLSEDYAKDKNNIYSYDRILEGADIDTFEVLNDFFAKDKNYVYTYGQINEGLDPETFDPDNPKF